MRLRYTGTDDARDLALSSGFITFPRGEWIDIEEAAEKGGLRIEHALITARDVAEQDDWELEGKPSKPRKAAAKKRAAKKSGGTIPDGQPVSVGPDEDINPVEPANEETDQ